ncbi:MAG: lytic transglycosylase domain-containing protein [Selenomonas ruminantium]|nr:lytic transglycosylase domain-containing protein [Selenomonas ruminantium]
MSSLPEKVEKARQARRRIGCAFCLGLMIFFSCFTIYFLSQNTQVQRSYLYPFPYRDTVERYASRYKVDCYLVAAVIKVESKFQHDVHSHRGAVGLMQLMPDTADWIAQRLGERDYQEIELHDPDRNIRYGIWYLADLEAEFKGNDVLALAAYNAGRGNVRGWMEDYGWNDDFSDVQAIPYKETRAYVKQVLSLQGKYRKLYAAE